MATLKEIVDAKVAHPKSCAELSRAQLVKLVTKRIEQQRNFQIAMVGIGVLDKKRAIREVKAQSQAGKILTEIERRVIDNQLERVRKHKR